MKDEPPSLDAALDPARLEQAEELLREAVFQARASQAAGVSLTGHTLASEVGPGNCGLGEKPGAGLVLSERGAELLAGLSPELARGDGDPAGAGEILRAWVDRQDAQDRKRNHFLKDFRRTHGFDRRAYSADQTRAFGEGLEAVNADESRLRSDAARALLGALAG